MSNADDLGMNGGELSTVEQLALKYFIEHKSREEIMNAENNYLNATPPPAPVSENCYTSQKQTGKLTEIPNREIPTLFLY